MLDLFSGRRGLFAGGGGSGKTSGSTENLLTELMQSIYVDSLSLGLIMGLILSPSLAPNASHFERISVGNAGSEPSSSSSSSFSLSTTTLVPPPPTPLCLTLRIYHASLSEVSAGRVGTGTVTVTVTGEFAAPPRPPLPLLLCGTIVTPHVRKAEPWRRSRRPGRRIRQHQFRCSLVFPPLFVRPRVDVAIAVNILVLLPETHSIDQDRGRGQR